LAEVDENEGSETSSSKISRDETPDREGGDLLGFVKRLRGGSKSKW
jgi:hypothetical protein